MACQELLLFSVYSCMYLVFCFCLDHLLVEALRSDMSIKLSRLTFLVVVLSLSIQFHVKVILLGL